MKKLISIFLLIALLSGCGAPDERSVSVVSSKAAASAAARSEQDSAGAKSPTDEEIKEILESKKLDCKYKSTISAFGQDGSPSKFAVFEIVEVSFTTDIQADEKLYTTFEINGTFQASGSIDTFEHNLNLETAEPGGFRIAATRQKTGNMKDTLMVHDFNVTVPPLVKPSNIIDIDEIPKYLREGDVNGINGTSWTTIFAPNNGEPLDTPIGKVDVENPNLRIVVLEDPYPDETILLREYKVEVFDGDEYLCTGYLAVSYKEMEPCAVFISFPDKLRKLR